MQNRTGRFNQRDIFTEVKLFDRMKLQIIYENK